jgi:hypothetical protein
MTDGIGIMIRSMNMPSGSHGQNSMVSRKFVIWILTKGTAGQDEGARVDACTSSD